MQLRAMLASFAGIVMAGSSGAADTSSAWRTLDGKAPLVIAHRGASGYRPEHTLESYRLAIEMGADVIEPDLVATKDGHLVARHEPMLDDTTDVRTRPDFADRRSTRTLEGKEITGFFASDFTLAEIKQLRAVQSNPARSKEYDGRFEIPSFEEILALRERESKARGRSIGVYPETKHPSFHRTLGLPLEDRMLDALSRHGLKDASAPVFIQSFESDNLQYLSKKTQIRLVQLLEDHALEYDASGRKVVRVRIERFGDDRGDAAPVSFEDISEYAYAVGPWKRHIVRDTGAGKLLVTELIAQAHAARLAVHAYTFRNEPATLAPEYANDPMREYRQFFELGLDGLFTDFPDTALAARRAFSK